MDTFEKNITRRDDGSFVITRQGCPYHVPNSAEFVDLYEEVSAYAEEHPENVTEESPFHVLSDEEQATARVTCIRAELAEIDDRKARPVSCITAWLLMPEAKRDPAGVQDEAAILATLDEQASALRAELQILEAKLDGVLR